MTRSTITGAAAATTLLLALFTIGACSTSSSADKSASETETASETSSENDQDSAPPDGEEVAEEAAASEATAPEPAANEESEQKTQTPEGIAATLPDGARPFDGIITAGQPTKAQFDKLDEAGVQTVINLRTEGEQGTWDEEAKAEEMGLEYVDIPVGGPDDLTRDKVDLFSDVLRKEEGTFLVHCGSSNRVGAMFALRAFWILEKPAEEAMAVGQKAGLDSLKEAVRAKIEEGRE